MSFLVQLLGGKKGGDEDGNCIRVERKHESFLSCFIQQNLAAISYLKTNPLYFGCPITTLKSLLPHSFSFLSALFNLNSMSCFLWHHLYLPFSLSPLLFSPLLFFCPVGCSNTKAQLEKQELMNRSCYFPLSFKPFNHIPSLAIPPVQPCDL